MNGAHVLVVDDDEAFCDLMASHLRRHGYTVEVASSGAEALTLFHERGPFAVLVTDLSMPAMDGLELMGHARQLDPWLEVLIITAAGTMEAAISAMRQDGAYDFLLKPLESINQLSLAVWRAAAHRQLRLEKERLQARLAAEAERLRALIANASDAIVASDAQGVVSVANAAASRLLEQDDLAGKDAMQVLPKPLAAPLLEWMAVGGGQSSSIEVSWPAGAVQRVTLNALPPAGTESDGWVMVVSDITHLRQAEELKRRLLADAADHVRSPLAQAVADLKDLERLADGAVTDRKKLVARLASRMEDIQGWVDGLSGFMDVDKGRGLKPGLLSLPDLVAESLQGWTAGPVQERHLRLEMSAPDPAPRVWVDRELMLDVLRRLIQLAAVEAKPQALLTVALQRHQQQVWVEVVEGGRSRRAPAQGEPRSSAGSDSWIAAEEAGIEAALVREMVARLGGQVWVRGTGPGATLAISLPMVEG